MNVRPVSATYSSTGAQSFWLNRIAQADSYAVGVGIRLLLATLIGLADQEKEVFFLTDFSDQSFGIRSPTRSCLLLGSVTGATIPILHG